MSQLYEIQKKLKEIVAKTERLKLVCHPLPCVPHEEQAKNVVESHQEHAFSDSQSNYVQDFTDFRLKQGFPVTLGLEPKQGQVLSDSHRDSLRQDADFTVYGPEQDISVISEQSGQNEDLLPGNRPKQDLSVISGLISDQKCDLSPAKKGTTRPRSEQEIVESIQERHDLQQNFTVFEDFLPPAKRSSANSGRKPRSKQEQVHARKRRPLAAVVRWKMSAAALVEKATSDLLIGPDWGRNLELCDLVNNDPGQAKEVVKAAKKRLAIKNSTVQLLTLTVLETLIKNCGDAVHQQVAERDVLHEMVKIVKKKADMNVRDKILSLLDSWQEAFGGQRGRYPQYFAAYDELRRSGVEFPQRDDAVPIFTPPQTHPITAYPPGFPQPYPPPPYAGFVPPEQHMPPNTNVQPLSSSDLDNARGGMEVLQEMLNVMDPHDKSALNGEVIQDLVEQCRITQRQVMNLVNTTTDETLLFQALSLNDDLQKVLAKRDAIASGTPLPLEDAIPVSFAHDEDDSEDDFAQLAHRPLTRNKPTAPSPPKIAGPVRITKLPAPPGASPKQQQAVDLLSGDILGGTQSAQAAVDNHKPEDPNNINPFASASNGQQQQTATTAQSQQALLYGAPQATPYTPSSSSSSSLPPPPIKYSQRQQYFQQQQEYPRPDYTQDQTEYPPQPQPEYSRTDNDLAVKTQKLSIDQLPDDDMQNPYAALYAQQQAHQEERRRQEKAKEETKFKKTESLFSDLVELQSARMKSRSG